MNDHPRKKVFTVDGHVDNSHQGEAEDRSAENAPNQVPDELPDA
jgi:hypothetical protein